MTNTLAAPAGITTTRLAGAEIRGVDTGRHPADAVVAVIRAAPAGA